MLLEVRLGIPSKPKKVLRPSDISLRSVLEKARNEKNKNNQNEKGSEINDKNDRKESDNVIEKTADTNTISAVAAPTKQTTTSVSGGNTNTNTNTNKSTQNSKKKTSQELPKITPTPGPSPISTPTPTPTTTSSKEALFSPTESLASLVLGRGEIEINCVGNRARHEQVKDIFEMSIISIYFILRTCFLFHNTYLSTNSFLYTYIPLCLLFPWYISIHNNSIQHSSKT